ncbi:MAG: response regulator transcription factor [Candidatus Kapabacteria bacterium]|jgi:DNA-binding NarL/FixJ family response regulator|nr:response regulator transcription factor [Candidatus Kapabacteria bacterium]
MVSPITPLRVLVADDHEIARFALVQWLRFEQESNAGTIVEILAVATCQKALETIRAALGKDNAVDMLIIDLDLPDMTGLEAIQILRSEGWQKPILVISGSYIGTAKDALAAGANGFLSKQEAQDVFLEGFRFIAQNPHSQWVSPQTHRQIMLSESMLKKADLTSAEQNVLRYIKRSNKEIADELGITESTVKKHLWSIFQKLGISSRYDAIAFAVEAGLIATRH